MRCASGRRSWSDRGPAQRQQQSAAAVSQGFQAERVEFIVLRHGLLLHADPKIATRPGQRNLDRAAGPAPQVK